MRSLLTTLSRFENAQSCRLPRLLVLSDEARGYGLEVQLQKWPISAAFIERTYGQQPKPTSHQTKRTLRLATTSPALARRAGLNGLHWPSRRLKYRHASATSGLIETTSAHRGLDIARATAMNLDGVLISTAFKSDSPSARRPLGAIRLAQLARAFPDTRLFALGGMNAPTIRALRRTGVYGVALVTGF